MKNLSIMLLLFLVACATKQEVVELRTKPSEPICRYPYSLEVAPKWVCGTKVEGYLRSAYGIAELNKNKSISVKMYDAEKQAKGKIAEQIQDRVSRTAKIYLSAYIIGNEEIVTSATYSVVESITADSLINGQFIEHRVGPNGRVFVVVGISEAQNYKIIETAVRTAIKNKPALWQQFKLDQSFSEMAQSIADMG